MGKGTGWREWLKQLAVTVAYALVYIAIHPISDAHWQIRSGMRLACLLLVPYRYWPAMLIAEAIPNAYEIIPCLAPLGLGFVIVRCIPPMLLAMPIVWWCRERLSLFPARRIIDIKVLMLCVLMVATVGTAYDYLSISFVHTPTFHAVPVMALGYFIGSYIAILAIVPLALMTASDLKSRGFREQCVHLLHSRLSWDTVTFALPFIAVLALVSLRGSEDMRVIARMSMFLPIAWLTLKHGWRAAVVGGLLAITSTCLLVASRPDPQILEIQAFIALAITCLLATGSRISAQIMQEDRIRRGEISARRLARNNFQMSEQRRRQVSATLEGIAGNLHVSSSGIMEQLRRILPGMDGQGYFKQVRLTQAQVYELAESMHPLAWRERGLPAALNETIARALDEAGIEYQCNIVGRGFMRMSPSLLAAAYRAACEAVVLTGARLTCTKVNLTMRGGESEDLRWLVLRVEGRYSQDEVAYSAGLAPERKRLATKLGTNSLTIEQLRDYVSVFNGELYTRASMERERITVLLKETPMGAEDSETIKEPLRLWVS